LSGRIRFAEFELDVGGRALFRAGSQVRLQQQPLDVLAALVERPGQLVSRDDLRQRLWQSETFVDFDHSLNIAVNKLRTALDDSADHPRFIETIPRRGYKFIGTIVADAVPAALAVSALTGPAIPVPPRIERTVPRALLVSLVLGLAVAIAVVVFTLSNRSRGGAENHIRTIAVMPLEDLSDDASSARYFADSMTDALITALAQAPDVRVISRTSVVAIDRKHRPLPELAARLGADVVLEGTIVRVGTRLRLTAQLIDAATDRHLWARSYEREMRDVLSLQNELTAEVAKEIGRHLETRAAPSVEPAAFDEYLRGRFAWNARTEPALREAVAHFIRATEIDHEYAAAYAGLADCYTTQAYLSNITPSDGFQAARLAAERALRLDDSLADAHASLAYVHFYYDWDWSATEREFRQALTLNPNYAVGHQWYAVFLTAMSRPGEARVEVQNARVLDPLSPAIATDLGFQLYYTRQYDDAIEALHDTIGRYPAFPLAHLWLGRVYQQRNRFAESIAEYQAAEHGLPDWPVAVAAIGSAEGWSGDAIRARQSLDRLHGLSRRRYVTAYGYALVHAALNERGDAIKWLEQGADERTPWMVWMKLDPRWGTLSSDPRFAAVARRVGLP
jgi:TolB-like protein/DNA-binding winged helix-turn-helix (wHTH) protein